jgi:hypothetical protein
VPAAEEQSFTSGENKRYIDEVDIILMETAEGKAMLPLGFFHDNAQQAWRGFCTRFSGTY